MARTTARSLVGPLRFRCCWGRHHGYACLQWWCRSPLRPRHSRARSVDQWCPALVGSQSRPFRELSAVAIASPIATARPTASTPPGSAQPKDSPLLPVQPGHRATTAAAVAVQPVRASPGQAAAPMAGAAAAITPLRPTATPFPAVELALDCRQREPAEATTAPAAAAPG